MTATLTHTLGFTTGAKEFASAVGWAAKRVPSRPTVPTLGGILLEVADGVLTVSGFDYDASASARVPAEDASDGRVLVSGRLLAGLVGTFPDRPIEAVASSKLLTLTCGRAQVALPLMDVGDYPELPHLPTVVGEVDGAVFARAVRMAGSACDFNKDRGKTDLTGVSLSFDAEVIRIDAANGHRANWDDIPWRVADQSAVGSAALPLGAHLTDAVADLAADGETVTIGLAGGLLSLATPSRSVILRLLAEPFGHFRSRVGAFSDTPAVVDVADLKTAVDRVRLLSGAKEVPLAQLSFGAGEVIVRGTTEDAAAAEAITIEYDGDPVLIVVNVRYLLAALAMAGDTTVQMSVPGPRKPVLFRPASGGTYRQLVMPTDPKFAGVAS